MSDKLDQSEYQNLDARLREVESSTNVISVTISNVGQDISDLKKMMQSFMAQTVKVAELGVKVRVLDRLGDKVELMDKRQDDLNSKIVEMKSDQRTCLSTKRRSDDFISSLGTKVTSLESQTLKQLTTIQADLSILKNKHKKVDGVLWSWGSNAGWLFIAGLFYLLLNHGPEAASYLRGSTQNPIPKAIVQYNSQQGDIKDERTYK